MDIFINVLPPTFFIFIYLVILVFRYKRNRGAIFGYIGFGLIVANAILSNVMLSNGIEPWKITMWTIPLDIVSFSLFALMLLTLPGASGKLLDTGEEERLNAGLSLEQFSEYYLGKLKNTLSKFSTFFLIIAGLVFIQFIVGVFILFSAIGGTGGIAAAFQQTLSFGMLVWLAILVRNLVNLQTEKVENDIVTTIKHRKESKSMSEEILKKAEQKAAHKITINGDNAMLAIDGGTISGSSQVKNEEKGSGHKYKYYYSSFLTIRLTAGCERPRTAVGKMPPLSRRRLLRLKKHAFNVQMIIEFFPFDPCIHTDKFIGFKLRKRGVFQRIIPLDRRRNDPFVFQRHMQIILVKVNFLTFYQTTHPISL